MLIKKVYGGFEVKQRLLTDFLHIIPWEVLCMIKTVR